MGQKEAPELMCHVGPVTALTVCSQKLLWGCGSEISVFDLTTNKLEIRQQVLSGASVHGIRIGPSNTKQNQLLCVHGAKQARVVSIDLSKHNEQITVLSDTKEFCDWIWDVRWLNNEPQSDSIAIALAHNSVLRWDWKSGKILSQRDCVEKCILYCSHFIGNTWENLMLAAGTVFNQILLWPVSSSNQADKEPAEIMHRFSGHQGVIFSIRYHQGLQRLCSVSDDRSICMWQLTFPNRDLPEPTVDDWRCIRSDLLLTLYGHSARVWDVVLTSTYFASVGEDAICCVWNYSGTILHKFKGHKGRSIWRVATTEDEKFVVTGGGDASIRMWQVHREKTNKTSQRIVSVHPRDDDAGQVDYPRTVEMLNFDLILIMMNSGDLYSYSFSDQLFSILVSDGKFRSYSIVSPCPDQVTVALGSITGDVRIFQLPETQDDEMKYFEVNLFSGKVLALTWMDRLHLLASGPGGVILVHRVESCQDPDTEHIQVSIKLLHQLALPPGRHRWITAACFVPATERHSEACDDTSQTVIVCGDKDGSVHCYSLWEGRSCGPDLQPSRSFSRVHSKAGVTFVCYREGLVYTAGRDGFYRQWQVKAGELSQLHGNKVVKGLEWIDRLEWYNNDLLVYGFFSSLFVVWSISYNQQLMSVHCGGGHRAWGCCHDNEMLRFAYLKAGKVYVVDSGHQARQIIVQPELHGRKVCDVKCLAVLLQDSGRPTHIVCTAGEDTTINIGAFVKINDLYSWRPITSLKGHKSSVISLAVSSCNVITGHIFNKESNLNGPQTLEPGGRSNPFILFSGGGRAEIRAWRLGIVKGILSQDVVAPAVGNINLKERNVICDKAQSSHIDIHQDCTALDDLTENLSASSNILRATPGRPVTSSMSGITVSDSPDQIQCNYQHLSTHFLGELHRRLRPHKQRLDPETRIMSLAASSLASLSNGHWDEGSNDKVSIRQDLSRVHILSCAGSDKMLRVFAFDEHSKTFSGLAESSYHQGCVLKVLHYVHYVDEDHHRCFAVSASTNGEIVFWPLGSIVAKLTSNILSKKHSKSFMNSNKEKNPSQHTGSNDFTKSGVHDLSDNWDAGSDANADSDADADSDANADSDADADNDADADSDADADCDVLEDAVTVNISDEETIWGPVACLKVHQSGVNSLHALQISESQLLLASGGDDNAVTVQLLETCDSGLKVMAKVTKENAHAAQVTGIHLVSATLVVSASIDQRICVWSIKQTPDSQIQLQLVACKYVDVADVSSMSAYLHKDSVFLHIAGEGMCLYKLEAAGGTF